MCTAATYKTKSHYFGRNLDLEYCYHESVIITPRNYPFHFRKANDLTIHYAIIGIGIVEENYPLYYDATNEKGLSMAGLNFPGNAEYKAEEDGTDNIASFEFIPWILGQCSTIKEAKELLTRINLTKTNFSNKLPSSPLHWIIADRDEAITVESVKDGLKVYPNPVGILTNNPSFDFQLFNLNNYMNISTEPARNCFSSRLGLKAYSRGMGALGLPGDLSSSSRFVKATFTKLNSISGDTEAESVSQFFHILGSVEQQRGCVHIKDRQYEITVYSSCCNTDEGKYYYKTYENSQISCVDIHKENLDGTSITAYPLITKQQINYQN